MISESWFVACYVGSSTMTTILGRLQLLSYRIGLGFDYYVMTPSNQNVVKVC